MIPVLETARLLLREMEEGDLQVVAEMLGDKEVMAAWPRPYSRGEAAEWIARQRERYARDGLGYWLAIDRRLSEPVGQAGIMTLEINRRPEAAIGYILRRRFWGEGYATEAAAASRDHAFRTTDRERVVALIRPTNLASQAVARRIGMRPVGLTMHANLEHLIFAVRRPQSGERSADGRGGGRGEGRGR